MGIRRAAACFVKTDHTFHAFLGVSSNVFADHCSRVVTGSLGHDDQATGRRSRRGSASRKVSDGAGDERYQGILE